MITSLSGTHGTHMRHTGNTPQLVEATISVLVIIGTGFEELEAQQKEQDLM